MIFISYELQPKDETIASGNLQHWTPVFVYWQIKQTDSFQNSLSVLDVETFERLLGSCMEVLKRNINDYESQLVKIFGSKYNISDIRWGGPEIEAIYREIRRLKENKLLD